VRKVIDANTSQFLGEVSLTDADIKNGFVNVRPLASVSDGSHTLSIAVRDSSGNVTGRSDYVLTTDTSADAPVVTLSVDSGAGSADGITNNALLNVSKEDGAALQYSTNGGSTWSSSFAAQEGANNLLVRQIDKAGNVSAGQAVSFTLDTQVDTGVKAQVSVALSQINASSKSNVAYTVDGLDSDASASLVFTDDAGFSKAVAVTANGSAATNLSGLADGNITVSLNVTDVAGNSVSRVGPVLRLDSTPPVPATIGTVAGNDVINLSEANNSVALAGQTEIGSSVSVRIDC
jgi:hypothetical protein